MAFNSSGQISYLVLDSLASGAKYGLEIIEYISKKTGGNYILKKPTLYSCLTRMEKKGLVSSSYWGESELGGKRHYYSITNSGRENLEELSRLFANVTYSDVSDADYDENQTTESEQESEKSQSSATSSTKILQQENIFNMVKEEKQENLAEEDEDEDVVENQIDIFNMEPLPAQSFEQTQVSSTTYTSDDAISSENRDDEEKMAYYQSKLEHSPEMKSDEKKDDAVFLQEDERITPAHSLTPDQEEQNKRIYDTSSELKKYRKKKSFSENQIEMSVVYEDENYEEIQKERIAELKKSLLNLKQNNFKETTPPSNSYSAETTANTTTQTYSPIQNDNLHFEKEYVDEKLENLEQNKEKERVDDAIFITEPRISDEQIPIQRKISPPNIDVNIYADNLPAPKRNSELEPTYKDMMAKLFERKKEKETKSSPASQEQIQVENIPENATFTDYDNLKRYYQNHGIAFNEYKKTNIERHHNTNLLNLISSAFLLLLSGVGCAILFGIIAGTANAKAGTNFMFYTLPLIFLALTIFDLFRFKFAQSKKATLFYNDVVNWVIFILGTIIVVVINVICNMQLETFGAYSTTLFVPIFGLLLLFPINFYVKKFLYKRYGK